MAATLHDPRYKRLVRLLKEAREGRDLTQEALGKRLKRPQSYLGKIETHQRRLDALEFFDLLEAMEVDPGPFAEHVALEIGRSRRTKRSHD